MTNLFFYRKLVKNTTKSGGLKWMKLVDKNLKSQSGNMSKFRNHKPGSIQLEADGAQIVEPSRVEDATTKHFQSVSSNHCLVDTP
jgi:hypothetical protein